MYYNTVKLFNFMGMNFCGLMTSDDLDDTKLMDFKLYAICITKVNIIS